MTQEQRQEAVNQRLADRGMSISEKRTRTPMSKQSNASLKATAKNPTSKIETREEALNELDRRESMPLEVPAKK